MNQSKQNQNKKTSAHICKQCKQRERVTLYFCQPCREKHNKSTRELKRKYRSQGKCVMCGIESDKRRCENCFKKFVDEVKNSPFLQSKRSKTGVYGKIEQISEVI